MWSGHRRCFAMTKRHSKLPLNPNNPKPDEYIPIISPAFNNCSSRGQHFKNFTIYLSTMGVVQCREKDKTNDPFAPTQTVSRKKLKLEQ